MTAVSRNPVDEPDDVAVVGGDASDAAQVARLFEQTRPDIVYILTSDSRGGPDLDFVQASVQNDVVTTINILVEATRHKCKHVVMTGSLDEPDGKAKSATPSTPYGAAKWVIGGYARMFMRLYGTPISILRPMMTYGPGQKSYKLIPSIVEALLQDRKAKLGSGSTPSRLGVHRRCRRCFRSNRLMPLRSTEPLTWQRQARQHSRVALLIGSLTGPLASAGVRSDQRDRPYEEIAAADTHPAAERLGWRATTPLREGLKRTIAAIESRLDTSR